MAEAEQYKRPPITEAIIELRFREPVKKAAIDRAARRLSGGRYPFQDTQENRELTIDFKSSRVSDASVSWQGYQLSSADRIEVAMVRTTGFIGSRLAPYDGWATFTDRFKADWKRVKDDLGAPLLGRVGVRFINRIDIPGASFEKIDVAEFLNIGISMPKLDLEPMSNYVLQVARRSPSGECSVVINSGTVVSPLVGYLSVLLDIDVSTETVPVNETEVWGLVDRMRIEKNKIFEASITDNARRLFR